MTSCSCLPGDYTVRAEQSGFKKFQASGIHLDVNQVYNLPVTLTVGAVSEEIIVEANPVQVQQTDMQLGSTVEGQQIVDIPLNGRNWVQLQQLQPGIVGTSDRFGGGNGAYSGNGAESQQNSFLINGVDSNDSSLNTALVIPSPDSIGEFRMITNTLNPEYGRNSGTVINAQIKNGTNAFHGSGFEFYRDTFLDAKGYFEARPTPFHQNEYRWHHRRANFQRQGLLLLLLSGLQTEGAASRCQHRERIHHGPVPEW